MEQEFSGTQRVVVGSVSVRIGANVRVQQIRFAVFDDSIGILEIGLAFPNGLNFRASKRDPGFEFVQQKVVMACGTVDRSISLSGGYRFPGFPVGLGGSRISCGFP